MLPYSEVRSVVRFADDRHPSPESLERYSMGLLAGPELESLEEHLLVCEDCQDALAREDAVTLGMRDAAATLQQQPVAPSRWSWPQPRWAFGLALAVLALVVFAGIEWSHLGRASLPAAVVFLQTARGPEIPSAAAPANRPLILDLDLTGLQQFLEYRLEIVDALGHPLFESKAIPRDNHLRAAFSSSLRAGAYFVRVYGTQHDLLREYALTVI